MSDVATRLLETQAAVARSARDVGREPSSVTLVAVSKTMPEAVILPALEAGQRVFGENYVQEAMAKWPGLRNRFPDVELHMIGPLQSNKAREAVELFDVIQSLDRESLAKELAREIARSGRAPRLFVQVNTGDEPQKGGVSPSKIDAFLDTCRVHHGLVIDGLMCIPPAQDQPSPHFGLLAKIAARNGLRWAVDGHERRLRGRDPVGRDACPRRQRDFWRAGVDFDRRCERQRSNPDR